MRSASVDEDGGNTNEELSINRTYLNNNKDQSNLAKAKLLLVCVRQVAAYDWQLHISAGDSTPKSRLPLGGQANTVCHGPTSVPAK